MAIAAATTEVSALTVALIGAGGALIGTFASAGTQAVLEWRRASRERKKAADQTTAELRQAVRLVIEELADAERLLTEAVRTGRYWGSERWLSTDVWTTYRATLAVAIDDSVCWRIITSAFDTVNEINWRMRGLYAASPPRPGYVELVSGGDGTLDDWRSIRAGIDALEGTIGVQGPASRLLRDAAEIETDLWDANGSPLSLYALAGVDPPARSPAQS